MPVYEQPENADVLNTSISSMSNNQDESMQYGAGIDSEPFLPPFPTGEKYEARARIYQIGHDGIAHTITKIFGVTGEEATEKVWKEVQQWVAKRGGTVERYRGTPLSDGTEKS